VGLKEKQRKRVKGKGNKVGHFKSGDKMLQLG
jgi:hypothetical protein